MTEETPDNDSADAAGDDTGPRAGERLAAARREKQISIVEISKELHLDEYKVRALERNDFEVLGAPVFAKGHLRKYAQLVGISIDDVLADYYALEPSRDVPPVVGPARRPARELHPGKWLLLVLVLAALAGAYWWFVEREVPARPAAGQDSRLMPPATREPAATGAAMESESADDITFDEPDTASIAEVTSEPATPLATAQPEPAPPARAPLPGQLQVTLLFEGDCWTEITDAAGDRLFFGLGAAGRSVEVAGAPPLSVLFGNAENVRLRVEGLDYPIPASSRRGRTARFTLQAP